MLEEVGRRLVAAWAGLTMGPPEDPTPSPTTPWPADRVIALRGAPVGGREKRILLLFCEGDRPTVPGSELTEKFACGSPLDGDRDLPATSAFCRKHGLAFPIRRTGDATKDRYRILFDHDQRRSFAA